MDYINILRPKNLLIVGTTQVLIYFLIFRSFLEEPHLSGYFLGLLVLDTLLITASGYVINDIFDQKIDQINKPASSFVGQKITVVNSWKLYISLLITGFAIAIYIALGVGEEALLFLYPLAVGLLYIYSYSWKGLPLIGNVVVSLFVTFVPGILLLAERRAIVELIDKGGSQGPLFLFVIFAYMTFAFLTTMMRELIKDIEDEAGDKQLKMKTLPLVIGIEKARGVSMIYGISILSLLLFICVLFWKIEFIYGLFLLGGLLIPQSIWIIYLTYQARLKEDFGNVSRHLKILMVIGLLSIFILTNLFS